MLGFSVAGDDVNGDGLDDIAHRRADGRTRPARPAAAPSTSSSARARRGTSRRRALYADGGYTNDPANPAPPSPIGSRYDGFQRQLAHGISLAALPDVNGDGYGDLAIGMPDAGLHSPGGGGVAVLYGKPQGVHITLNDLWEAGYPYYFHVDFPALDNQHVGESVASVGDMTGDGWPDIAVGAPQADFNGRADSGSVWIISGHLPPIDAAARGTTVDATLPVDPALAA